MFECAKSIFQVVFSYNGRCRSRYVLAIDAQHAASIIIKEYVTETEIKSLFFESITLVDDVLK